MTLTCALRPSEHKEASIPGQLGHLSNTFNAEHLLLSLIDAD
jgi:hypothetical protein